MKLLQGSPTLLVMLHIDDRTLEMESYMRTLQEAEEEAADPSLGTQELKATDVSPKEMTFVDCGKLYPAYCDEKEYVDDWMNVQQMFGSPREKRAIATSTPETSNRHVLQKQARNRTFLGPVHPGKKAISAGRQGSRKGFCRAINAKDKYEICAVGANMQKMTPTTTSCPAFTYTGPVFPARSAAALSKFPFRWCNESGAGVMDALFT